MQGKKIVRFLLLPALGASISQGQVQVLGKGSYLVERTAAVTKVPTDTWTASITADYSQKVLSNKWWATLMTKPWSGQLHAQPCAFKADAGGLQLDYPGPPTILPSEIRKRIFESPFLPDLKVGIKGMAAGAAKVAQVGHWSVKARWEDGARRMEAVMAQGSPFVFFRIAGGEAEVSFYASPPAVWHNEGGVIAFTVYGRHWALFAPAGSVWTVAGRLASNLGGKDYLSAALLPDALPATLALFRKYAYSHVADTKVTWEYDEARAELVSHFKAVTEVKEGTEAGTLFALFRHQWISARTPLTALAYRTVRGEMKVAEGREFVTAMTFNGILPVMPDTGQDPAVLGRLAAAIQPRNGEGQPYIIPTETYTCGKSLNRFGEAAQIAHITGNLPDRDRFIKAMKGLVENWFTADTGNQVFYYHRPSHRFIGYPQVFFTGEKGNDHNLHWAYFINAAATITQFDPLWGRRENWGGMVEMLIRDVAAWDEKDPLFEPFSYFDPYEGHGWLDGEGFEIGNNHESTSESMNLNVALIKWGMQTGNKALRDLGIFMYVHETRATEQYWWDVDRQTMPAGWAYPGVGLVWTNGGRFLTWFSEEPWHVTGIQLIPNTGGHLYLGRRPDYITRNFKAANPQVSRWGWYDLHLQYLAYGDVDLAWDLYHGNRADTITGEETESPAHTYYHIAGLRAVGRIDTTVVADIPGFGVFRKGNVRTYNAWNPGDQTRRVLFSDGFSMEVPARSQSRKSRTVPPIAVRQGAVRRIEARPRRLQYVPGQGAVIKVAKETTRARLHALDGTRMADVKAKDGMAVLPAKFGNRTWILKEE